MISIPFLNNFQEVNVKIKEFQSYFKFSFSIQELRSNVHPDDNRFGMPGVVCHMILATQLLTKGSSATVHLLHPRSFMPGILTLLKKIQQKRR